MQKRKVWTSFQRNCEELLAGLQAITDAVTAANDAWFSSIRRRSSATWGLLDEAFQHIIVPEQDFT